MTDFVQFTPARKAQIKHLRTRLMTVKPERDLKYGTKYKRLFLTEPAGAPRWQPPTPKAD